MSPLSALSQKLGFHLGDQIRFFLSHGLPQGVRLPLGESCQLLRKEHHLLLIYRNTVSLFKIFLTCIHIVRDGLGAVLSANERWDVFQRSWTVKSVHRNQVSEDGRLQLLQVFLHTCRVELKNINSLPSLEQFVCLHIVQRKCIRVKINPMTVLDIADSILDDGQRFETQEIHLQQPCVFRYGVVKLGARHVTVLRD